MLSQGLISVSRDHELEAELGIAFVEPSAREISELENLCNSISEFFKCPGTSLEPPVWGTLAHALTSEQRRSINSRLTPVYAVSELEYQAQAQKVPIQESGEVMVDVPLSARKAGVLMSITHTPYHVACGAWGGKPRILWARKELAHAIVRMAQALNDIGLQLHLEDLYRPLEVQAGLFRRRFAWVQTEYPEWSFETALQVTKSMTACLPYIAAHMAGGAVDFTIRTLEGQPLDLGNEYPQGSALVALNCPYVTWNQFRTRALFVQVCSAAGLAVYEAEDWHASLGDALSAVATKSTAARYGPLSDFDQSTGAVNSLPAQEWNCEFEYPLRPLNL